MATQSPQYESRKSQLAVPFNHLPEDQVKAIIPPNVEMMISGVQRIEQNHTGAIRLIYQDGSDQSKPSKLDIEEFRSFFDIVGFVQD